MQPGDGIEDRKASDRSGGGLTGTGAANSSARAPRSTGTRSRGAPARPGQHGQQHGSARPGRRQRSSSDARHQLPTVRRNRHAQRKPGAQEVSRGRAGVCVGGGSGASWIDLVGGRRCTPPARICPGSFSFELWGLRPPKASKAQSKPPLGALKPLRKKPKVTQSSQSGGSQQPYPFPVEPDKPLAFQ